jgi:hypothetical protein
MLLARPDDHEWWDKIETCNDFDGLVSNFWRAITFDPEQVAHYADWPVFECDKTARHAWLVERKDSLQAKLEGDPDYYDAKVAGWWVWGMCIWIGGGWCSGKGPWRVVDGEMVKTPKGEEPGVTQQLPLVGRGINRQIPMLGPGMGINRKLPHLGDSGAGINRKLDTPDVNGDNLCEAWTDHVHDMMARLHNRLRRVRVCCGDWSRVMGPSVTFYNGETGVFLDPPYSADMRCDVYRVEADIAKDVEKWCKENQDNPLLKIALCGYSGEYDLPGWDIHKWQSRGGYGCQGDGRGRENREKETIWFSPHCRKKKTPGLLEWMEGEG